MGGGTPNTVQQSFRWRNDNGSESGATWKAATNANPSLSASDYDSNMRLRCMLENTGTKDESDGYIWVYEINDGTPTAITTTSSFVKAVASLDTSWTINDGDSTTQQIGAGTHDEGYMDEDGTIASFTLAQSQESENELVFQIVGADFSGGEKLEIYMRFDNNTDLDGYTNIATIASMPTPPSGTLAQTNYRIRLTDGQGLNAAFDAGDPAINTAGTVDADTRFRVRLEVDETASVNVTDGYQLRFQKNGAGGFAALTVENWPTTYSNLPQIHICTSAQYTDGAATTNVISGSSRTFVAGDGNNDNQSGTISLNNQHTEIEWCLAFHAIYDGANQLVDGDYFEFRVYRDNGTALDTYTNTARVNVNIPDGWIGGTMVERGSRILQADTNGNLYFFHEDTVPSQTVIMLKSSDGGKTWLKIGGAGPTTTDVESADISFDSANGVLHIIQQSGNTGNVRYHKFRTSDHATDPDTWEIKDEVVVSSLTVGDQTAGVEFRSDGTVVAFYQETISANERMRYIIRSSGGTWGSPANVDSEASTDFTFCAVTKGASDKIHIAYKDNTNGNLYHVSLSSGDSLGTRHLVHNDGGIGNSDQANIPVGPVYWNDGNERIMVSIKDESDNFGYSSIITDDGTPAAVVQATDEGIDWNTGFGSLGVPANMVIDPVTDDVYLIYGSATDEDMVLAKYTNGTGTWGTDIDLNTGVTVDVVASWIFTHSSGNGGNRVLGYIWENDSNGQTGYAQYDEYIIALGGKSSPPRLRPLRFWKGEM